MPLSVFAAAAIMLEPPGLELETSTGSHLFLARCVSCHPMQPNIPRIGPDLSRIGSVAATRRPGMSALQYIVESILDPGAFVVQGFAPVMPANLVADLAPAEVRELVHYLAAQGGAPSKAEVSALEVPEPRRDGSPPLEVDRNRMEAAVALFFGRGGCSACHTVHGRTSLGRAHDQALAPPILNAGLRDPARIRAAIADHKEAENLSRAEVNDLTHLIRVLN